MDYTVFFENYLDRIISSTNPDYPAWNGEYIISGRKNKWNYIDGCMINALMSLYETNHNPEIFRFCENFVSEFIADDGTIRTYNPTEFNLDNINPARNLITLYEITGIAKYRKAFEYIYSAQLEKQPRTDRSKSFWHKMIYPQQVWLDGIYMTFPFYAEYEVRYNDCKNIDDIKMQFENAEKYMRDEKTGLYYHGYDESRKMYWADSKTGLSSCFWLRAVGWLMCACTDTYEKLCSVSPETDKLLMRMLSQLAESISGYIHKNTGMLSQIINMPLENGNYCETSGTALAAYAMLKGARLRMIDSKYRKTSLELLEGIFKNSISFNPDGSADVENICLVAGLGGEKRRDGSIGYYLSEPVVKNDAKGIAPLFMLYSEILKGDDLLNG